MRKNAGRSIFVLTAATMAVGAAPAAAETVYGITDETDPALVTFDSATPGTFSSDVEITGLPAGRSIVGMDVRPATLQLVVLDDEGRFYDLDAFSGDLTQISTSMTPDNATLADARDIDFNPTVDRVRIVGQNGAAGAVGRGNARANPNTGAAVDGDPATGGLQPDGDLTYNTTDAGNGTIPDVRATAYTNSFPSSATFPTAPTTTQYDLEAERDVLVTQNPPNNGTLNTVGPFGVDVEGDADLDIVTDANTTTNRAYAAMTPAGTSATALYDIDLATGAATNPRPFPAARGVTEIAVAPVVPTLIALTETVGGTQAITAFDGSRPQDAGANSTTVTGLPAGVELLGIDQRPATGALYALGDDSRLYTIDVLTGRATAVGTGPFTPTLQGTDFGFDFNPQVDRIRVVSNDGQNLRLNPDTGAGAVAPPSAADGNLNGASTSVTAAAYTNSTKPAPAATTLYNLDTTREFFMRQDPPNAGTQVDIGPLNPMGSGLPASPANVVDEDNGFDIAARFNHGFAASAGELFNVNVAGVASGLGSAVSSGDLGIAGTTAVRGLAVFDPSFVAPPQNPGTPPSTPPATPPAGAPAPPPVVIVAPAKSRSRISYTVSPRRDRRAPFRYTIRGRIVPRGATPAVGVFNGGRVTVRAKRAGQTRTLVTRTARVTSAGRFTVRVTVPRRNLRQRRSGVVRLNLRFNGTDALFNSRAFARARYR